MNQKTVILGSVQHLTVPLHSVKCTMSGGMECYIFVNVWWASMQYLLMIIGNSDERRNVKNLNPDCDSDKGLIKPQKCGADGTVHTC